MGIRPKYVIKMNTIVVGINIGLLLLCCTLPASASEEYMLDIFGNANEDDTIDMEDVTYTQQFPFHLPPHFLNRTY